LLQLFIFANRCTFARIVHKGGEANNNDGFQKQEEAMATLNRYFKKYVEKRRSAMTLPALNDDVSFPLLARLRIMHSVTNFVQLNLCHQHKGSETQETNPLPLPPLMEDREPRTVDGAEQTERFEL
jgi:hypothetical protein